MTTSAIKAPLQKRGIVPRTDYEKFATDPRKRRLLRQAELQLNIETEISKKLDTLITRTGVSRGTLARKAGMKISELNNFLDFKEIDLRTFAVLCDALGYKPQIVIHMHSMKERFTKTRTD